MKYFTPLFALLVSFSLVQCTQKKQDTDAKSEPYLLLFTDQAETEFGYKTPKGDTIVPLGKYSMCFTDTFTTYAIVANEKGLIAIDRDEKKLYEVFNYDNGPDYASDGLFRFVQNGKIGYADIKTGKIVIAAKYPCAWPFENGKAQVALKCTETKVDEYNKWESDAWFYINKKGEKVE